RVCVHHRGRRSVELEMFGRPPVPRRALLAATIGALYGLLILPAPATVIGVTWQGISWFLLSVGLLFVIPLAYHAYTFWAILWPVYRGVQFFRSGGDITDLALALIASLSSLTLLFTSG